MQNYLQTNLIGASMGLSTLGNTSGNTGTVQRQLLLAGGNNVTLSGSTSGSSATITVSAPNMVFAGGISTGGNTSNTSGMLTGSVVLAGGNNITLSQATAAGGGTITVSAPNMLFAGGISNLGNTSGTSGVQAVSLVLAGGNNITLSQNTGAGGATVTISAPNTAAAAPWYENMDGGVGGQISFYSTMNWTRYSKRPVFIPFVLPTGLASVGALRVLASQNTGTQATSLNVTVGFAFYRSSNSSQISMVSSTTLGVSLTTSSLFAGIRAYDLLGGLSSMPLTAGDWWLALYMNGSNDSTAVMNIFPGVMIPGQTAQLAGSVLTGTNNSGAVNQTNQLFPFAGSYSATTATNVAFPAAVGRTDLSGSGQIDNPRFYFAMGSLT